MLRMYGRNLALNSSIFEVWSRMKLILQKKTRSKNLFGKIGFAHQCILQPYELEKNSVELRFFRSSLSRLGVIFNNDFLKVSDFIV
jgi:hypothetical protein